MLSSITNSLLVYYLLPDSLWIQNQLVFALGLVEPYRVAPQGTVVQGLTIGKAYLVLLALSFWTTVLVTAGYLKKLQENKSGLS